MVQRIAGVAHAYFAVQFLINVGVTIVVLGGTLAGGALLGHYFAILGSLSPFILLLALGLPLSLAGLINFAATLVWLGNARRSRSLRLHLGIVWARLRRKPRTVQMTPGSLTKNRS